MVSQEHEMKKAKSSIEFEPRDRLSELPDSLILQIFEFMPMTDVVRTSILSGRWKNLWTVTPCLCFHNHNANNDKLRSFVNRALLCWRGARVRKFKVSGVAFDASLFTEMDLWLRFAAEHGVEVLEVCFRAAAGLNSLPVDYSAPMCLYSCSSLQRLSLSLPFFCLKQIKGNVRWNRLKSLEIDCFVVTQHAIDQILCGSPLLEVFILNFRDGESDLELSFRSSSLKKLKIIKGLRYRHRPPINNTALRIWTPNLVMLSISGVKFNSCLLMDVSSLVHVKLFLYGNPFVRDMLSRILPAIQNVEELVLSESCIEVLGAMKIESLLSPFSNVTSLDLYYHYAEHERIVGLLEIFPKLKALTVVDTGGYVDYESMPKFKPAPSESFLLELKTFSVSWTGEDFLIFPFIKIVLRYASKLEKMVFRVKRTVPSNNLLLATKKLLKMPRSSPTSKLVIHEY